MVAGTPIGADAFVEKHALQVVTTNKTGGQASDRLRARYDRPAGSDADSRESDETQDRLPVLERS